MINIQNIDDNECFKWCLIRYLNPADHNPRKITKANKNFAKSFDFKYINFTVKIRDIYKIEKKKKKKKSIVISAFGYEHKKISNLYIKTVVYY